MNTVIPHIKQLLSDIDISLLPYQKGNKIYIGKSCIQKTNNGYKTFNNKKFICGSFTKIAAIIIAKDVDILPHKLKQIKELDTIVEKHVTDCIFYKNAYTKSKDAFRKAVLESRYTSSSEKITMALDKLSNILYSK